MYYLFGYDRLLFITNYYTLFSSPYVVFPYYYLQLASPHMRCIFSWINLTSAMFSVVDHLPDFMDTDYLLNLKEKVPFLHVLVAPSIIQLPKSKYGQACGCFRAKFDKGDQAQKTSWFKLIV